MGRAVRDSRIDRREARLRLSVQSEPYWRMISEGAHLGYYRGAKVAKWVARFRSPGGEGGYRKTTLGEADDVRDADGERILNFRQADAAARAWFSKCESDPTGEKKAQEAAAKELTVEDCVKSYIAMRDARATARVGRPIRSEAHRLTRHVQNDPALLQKRLCEVTEADLKAWRSRLSGLKNASRQRLVNDFKAALNAAYGEHRRCLPADMAVTIKYGFAAPPEAADPAEPGARENQILDDHQVRKLVTLARELDADGDFALLVLILAATGARFSQVVRMRVKDAQLDHSRVLVPSSRKGKARVPTLIKVPIGGDVIAALASAILGRSPDTLLLEHWRYRQISPTEWERTYRGPWLTPSEMTRTWRRIAAAADLPHAVPYALRHSSIVRAIRAPLPIRLVAALHDTSVAMIERHYSRWIADGLEEVAARAIVPLTSLAA